MAKLKYSYESLAIKKDLIKLRQKWKRILGANIILDITLDEQTGILHFKIEVQK